MTVISSGNSGLDNIVASYNSTETSKSERDEALGRDAFLKMLIAQLQNQDPLNPMDGTDFSAQLAQFSQLEQLMNLNSSMESLAASFANNSEKDLVAYVGKQVTGEVNSMQVENGDVSGGFYSLDAPGDVIVQISDSSGSTVRNINLGTQTAGTHLIHWDGTDNEGDAVDDGSYTYTVLANSGSGYTQVDNTVTGTADGVVYSNGKGYLSVQGILLDPGYLTSVKDISEDLAPADSAMSYLGKTVSSNQPILEVKEGVVKGSDLGFTLESAEDVTVKIYDPFNTLVQTIQVDADKTQNGENTVHWNAVGSNGYQVSDGLYYYTVTGTSGAAKTPVSEVVSGIRNTNGVQYLVMADTGRLVSLSSITAVTN